MKPFDENVMRRHWESEATDYARARQFSAVDEAIISNLNVTKSSRVLEIGFGSFLTGAALLEAFPEISFVGIDFAEKFVLEARRRAGGRAQLMKASASALPFRRETLDVIFEMDAIHHFPREVISEVVREIAALLKRGGRFLLAEDWAADPQTERERLAYAVQGRRFLTSRGLEYHPTEGEWVEMLEKAGLQVLRAEHVDRPLNLGRFEELKSEIAQEELARLKGLWRGEHPSTKMTLFISQR